MYVHTTSRADGQYGRQTPNMENDVFYGKRNDPALRKPER